MLTWWNRVPAAVVLGALKHLCRHYIALSLAYERMRPTRIECIGGLIEAYSKKMHS